ncbi:GNAT family N-acetyltransferase [Vicingus serpentipes]|uniref:GNAT family N-acetyltransferase n=1 Tax=Vicingus serpentipes TaxID=1926625 RepID=A0A5C6RYS0_9FLAO|nr:GNAT family N-acetyltransferase [Vicingus serpentipes]TXB67115.1 GNAT family N-acetyltransferase [Vicingus serpentipes]
MIDSKENVTITHKLINKKSGKIELIKNGEIAAFLHKHLEEYGDSIDDIQKAIDYIFDKVGGYVLVQFIAQEISGVVVVNETGMSGYIPENILVYIAMNKKFRGKGYGKLLMKNAIKVSEGDIALHVEKDNPARFLYERLGFRNPYLEMRLKK